MIKPMVETIPIWISVAMLMLQPIVRFISIRYVERWALQSALREDVRNTVRIFFSSSSDVELMLVTVPVVYLNALYISIFKVEMAAVVLFVVLASLSVILVLFPLVIFFLVDPYRLVKRLKFGLNLSVACRAILVVFYLLLIALHIYFPIKSS